MSLLGKLLIILNFLAMAGFLALGVMDYGKRQTWAHAVLRYDVAIHGIPVDEKETDLQGQTRVENLTSTLLKEALGSDSIKTQEQELQRAKQQLQAAIDNPEVFKPWTATQKQAYVMLQFARTIPERFLLSAVCYPQQADVLTKEEKDQLEKLKTELPAQVNGIFENPLQLPEKARKPLTALEYDHRRRAIAHVLVTLVDLFPEPGQQPDPEAQKDPLASKGFRRVLAVCGVKAVAQELDASGRVLQEMSYQLMSLVDQERLAFADLHETRINRVYDESQQVARLQGVLQLVTTQAQIEEARAKEQEKKVAELTMAWNKAQDATDEQLKTLSALQDRLFKTRLQVRDANRINQQLEREIRALEKKQP